MREEISGSYWFIFKYDLLFVKIFIQTVYTTHNHRPTRHLSYKNNNIKTITKYLHVKVSSGLAL